ncbi:MAG: diguanylate cyclase [Chloroflexota bacterium]|nr:MAG: diguanylate cyclase [Chloroflexota bacterium]
MTAMDRVPHAATNTASARLDSLDALPDRRHIERALDERLARLASGLGPGVDVALILVVVDHIDLMTEYFGTALGSAVLCHVAYGLQDALGSEALVGRWSLNEFAALVDAPRAHLAALADQVQAGVAGSEVGSAPGVLRTIAITGIAVARPGDTPAALFGRTDRALRRARASLAGTQLRSGGTAAATAGGRKHDQDGPIHPESTSA